jgi:hypothetical protein
MMMNRRLGLALLCIALGVSSVSRLCQAEMSAEAAQIVSGIARSEQRLQSVSANLVVTVPERKLTFVKGQWRYSRGREYLGGTMGLFVPDREEPIAQRFGFAFDGEKMEIYRRDVTANRHTGRVTALEPVNFTGYPTFNTLLGRDVNRSGRLSVSQALMQAENVSVQPSMDRMDGHACYVIEAIGIDKAPETAADGISYDVRLWIDPDRDYRVLRLEKYINEPGESRWKALSRRVDNITLQQIDGTWLPVRGEFHNFRREQVLLDGVSEADVRKMSAEEARKHMGYKLTPLVPMRVVEIDPDSITIGQEMPVEQFRIQWPQGTYIWDDFLEVGYQYGVSDKKALGNVHEAMSGEKVDDPSHSGQTNDTRQSPGSLEATVPGSLSSPHVDRTSRPSWIAWIYAAAAALLLTLAAYLWWIARNRGRNAH